MKKEVFFALFFMLVILAGSSYLVLSGSKSSSDSNVSSNVTPGGEVSTFSFDNNPVPVAEENSQVAGDVTETPEPVVAEQPTVLKIPDGWKLSNEKKQKSTCDEGITESVNIYKKGAETLTIYENAHPGGCDRKTIGDVMVDFDFIESGLKIKTNRLDAYSQCTKQQNPTCPKGDGKVTVFVDNLTDDKKSNQKNERNNNYYAFKLEDTTLDSNFNKQVESLLNIVDSISFVQQQQQP